MKFQLGLRIDSAKELLLLWRSIIVVEVIVTFLLIRQWVLWAMGYA